MDLPSTGMTLDQDLVLAMGASPDFTTDQIIFAARQSGLYRSDDGGLTWHFAYDSLKLQIALPTAAVALSPSFNEDRTLFAGVSGGVLRSIDGGSSWEVAVLPTPPPQVTSLAVSPDFARDGTLFAGTLEDGVFRSADRGRSWAAWNFGLLDLSTLALVVSPGYQRDETLFAATESGIFRSTNGGRAWREVPFPIDLAPVLSLALSPSFAEDETIYAGTEEHGLHASRDCGRTWEQLGADGVEGALNALAASQESDGTTSLVAVLGQAVLVSVDGGRSWQECPVQAEQDEGFTCLALPFGTLTGSPLLVGSTEGRVLPAVVP